MDELSLKVKIADREYPMKVKLDEEEKVRKATKLINEKLKTFRNQFGIDDKQDLLAMVAFDGVMKYLNEQHIHSENEEAEKLLENLNQSIEEQL